MAKVRRDSCSPAAIEAKLPTIQIRLQKEQAGMLLTILIGAAVFAVALWFAFQIVNRHELRLCRSIPSAQPCYPVLGNILLFTGSLDKIVENLLQHLEESVLNGQRALCFWIGAYPLVIITDPSDIKTVLNTSLGRGKLIEESCKEYSKYGLVTTPVDHWKVSRRHLNLSFLPRNLELLIPSFNSTSRQLVADLSRHVDGNVFDLFPHVMSAALKTMLWFLYGPKFTECVSTEQFNEFHHLVELSGKLVALRVSSPWLRNDLLFKMLYRKEIDSLKKACPEHLQIANKVSGKRKLLTNKKEVGPHEQYNEHGFQSIVEAMRKLQEKNSYITDQFLVDELNSFLAVGSDSIASSASACLLALARFPNIQDKVYEEICSVLSEDDEEDVAHADLKRLTYLDQVIKETLRFFTVAPFSTRAPTRDIDLGGYTIPANKLIVIFITSTCFNPKYFPDPYKFNPDRFSTPNGFEDVFIPFGRGPRNCIGKTYSMNLIKVMVTHVVRKYRLSTNMDIQHFKKRYTVILTCWDGYNVFLAKRGE